ncbi:sphingosine/diacylglycerol kinase-like enzyme [Terriglobus roseus DSM 18391]|uniref:Sphingosine/diacylglycerol kinase-like enzyme n=1 Tax=Terriglobus roseus (strain DSM 18391 / NRRL B-41598 / KBS 63) TaxID=926566 RepID=I3ZG88_TERRK|nr:diacylglycerol kinase family protein [Terriglobus roseus]AFL88256.1 sphingosine/diacylglycerol kinase-like enzyme [Terriglobus roseus DSM 18391]AFL88597.1 sphingosine/diacylglycerol kinase-like enzyme [Terriglobus roseus DSM 18391]
MRGLLLYNPQAGRNRSAREATVQQIASLLRGHGYELTVTATTHRGSAGDQARSAIAERAEVIFACGGDGTVHDVLQGIVGTSAKLAIIPLGSANALCRELSIPLNPLRAAAAYAARRERRVAVGQCVTTSGERYFLTMAGSGPDGALMYRMLTINRSFVGRWAYLWHALRLLLRGGFRPFRVQWKGADGTEGTAEAVSAMALRIGDLGGIFPGVARGATFNDESMRLVLVKAPALLAMPLWFLSSWLRLERWNPLLSRHDVVSFTCDGAVGRTHVQADGEWVGCLPAMIQLRSSRTITLLLPTTL